MLLGYFFPGHKMTFGLTKCILNHAEIIAWQNHLISWSVEQKECFILRVAKPPDGIYI
jgi:hypothetical protein